jgi:hypothetical protein
MDEAVLPTDPTHSRTVWPPQSLAMGAKLPNMVWVVIMLVWHRNDQLKIGLS